MTRRRITSLIDEATTDFKGVMSATDKAKLDGIAPGSGSTDLSYTAATRIMASSTGADATLPLVTDGDAGLAPASGSGTVNFLRADGSWQEPPGSFVAEDLLDGNPLVIENLTSDPESPAVGQIWLRVDL